MPRIRWNGRIVTHARKLRFLLEVAGIGPLAWLPPSTRRCHATGQLASVTSSEASKGRNQEMPKNVAFPGYWPRGARTAGGPREPVPRTRGRNQSAESPCRWAVCGTKGDVSRPVAVQASSRDAAGMTERSRGPAARRHCTPHVRREATGRVGYGWLPACDARRGQSADRHTPADDALSRP
jgi:hypothetical protein